MDVEQSWTNLNKVRIVLHEVKHMYEDRARSGRMWSIDLPSTVQALERRLSNDFVVLEILVRQNSASCLDLFHNSISYGSLVERIGALLRDGLEGSG